MKEEKEQDIKTYDDGDDDADDDLRRINTAKWTQN